MELMANAGKTANISGEYIGIFFSPIANVYMKAKNKTIDTKIISMVASVFLLLVVICVKVKVAKNKF